MQTALEGVFGVPHGPRLDGARAPAPTATRGAPSDDDARAGDDMKNIGMDDSQTRGNRVDHEGVRESGGFVAGLHIDERKSILPFRGPAGKGGHA